MGRPRKYPLPTTSNETEVDDVKVTLITTIACPDGVAKPGTVIDLPPQEAEGWKALGFVRDFDKDRDSRAPHGLSKPPERFE
jgi:hypothetical protein